MWNIRRQMASMFGGQDGDSTFQKDYACFPVSFIGRDDMENGNKILLPQSALHHLARINITWPMLFEMTNPVADLRTHSGVLEFIADEGTCYMPYWMMQNLLLSEGDICQVKNISLPKGQYVKLQPVTKDFLDLSNPRAVLETSLRNYATLTVGDNVVIRYLDKRYEIEIVQLKPADAVSIIETDIQVDFEAPKDYVEHIPQKHMEVEDLPEEPRTPTNQLFNGEGIRLDGKIIQKDALSTTGRKNSTRSDTKSIEPELSPWKNKLPGGIRQTSIEYERLVREGRIPGIIGKVRKRGIAKS